MSSHEFLTAELDHAQRQLARVRRLQTRMQADLAAAGLDELAIYEKLAVHKAYRQLQRDEIVFHQMWLRVHRHLLRLPAPAAAAENNGEDQLAAEIEAIERGLARPLPFVKPPTPGPNQPCSCGSNKKYKKCCGNPFRLQPRRAA